MDSKTLQQILQTEQEKANQSGIKLDINKEYFKVFFSYPKIPEDIIANLEAFHAEIDARQNAAIEYIKAKYLNTQ